MHDFIGTIFYVLRNAVPFALIGLAAGIALLVFTLSDDRDVELRGGSGWTTFVPALSGTFGP